MLYFKAKGKTNKSINKGVIFWHPKSIITLFKRYGLLHVLQNQHQEEQEKDNDRENELPAQNQA